MSYPLCYTVRMMIKKESIFNVTFTDGGEVFIQAMDEAHVRRIIGKNDLWRTDTEGVPFSRTIEKIEKVNGQDSGCPTPCDRLLA